MSDDTPRGRGLSRRRFLQVGAAGVVGAHVAAGAAEAQDDATRARTAGSGELVGPGAVPVLLTIDDREHRLSVEPRVTLLDAMRDRLGVTSAKEVCDRGTCGACTVLVDGRPRYACSMLAVEAEDQEIVTAAGLGSPEAPSAVQSAFVEADAQQCGACTPGFIVACHAMFDRDASPDDETIDRELGGNLCRCGTYAAMRRAVGDAARKGGRRG